MICVFHHFDFRVDDGCLKFYRINQVKIFFRSENILIIEVITHDIIIYLIIAYLLSKFIWDFSNRFVIMVCNMYRLYDDGWMDVDTLWTGD